ncbi:tRNA (adenosine(37)-N6)-dimethylallyltransferase MiaA [Membranicola marinus]|uniref:tRNA dimethylallyltransferase n=1 Tax=Membranihabitans marinus TaxID=1227546 RepID=A0A953HKU8_9BACT|nr:tRNA (adenosine(37)-N6)-dimethylallyltransferase MiaA [Membranihabitans marinus]MBY5957517.1 tRNA (adenosine(37)-N6)-dimethylallyltransferase MiaA [Membranihabitans marinus]
MVEKERIPALLILSGPTGSGKSALAEHIARRYDVPIISADSRQIYRYFNIGTAKPSPEVQAQIDYEMIDILEPHERFSAGKFAVRAAHLIEHTHVHKPVVIIAGGTGFYIKALMNGLADIPEITPEINHKWNHSLKIKGFQFIQKELVRMDPNFPIRGDIHNPHRVLRAIKVADQTGRSIFDYTPQPLLKNPHDSGYFQIDHDRKELYDRINHRVDDMMGKGLVEEVRSLLPYQDCPAMRSVGYQELLPYFDNQVGLDEATDKIKQHSRNYAKRQLTWLRNQTSWTKINSNDIGILQDWVESHL